MQETRHLQDRVNEESSDMPMPIQNSLMLWNAFGPSLEPGFESMFTLTATLGAYSLKSCTAAPGELARAASIINVPTENKSLTGRLDENEPSESKHQTTSHTLTTPRTEPVNVFSPFTHTKTPGKPELKLVARNEQPPLRSRNLDPPGLHIVRSNEDKPSPSNGHDLVKRLAGNWQHLIQPGDEPNIARNVRGVVPLFDRFLDTPNAEESTSEIIDRH